MALSLTAKFARLAKLLGSVLTNTENTIAPKLLQSAARNYRKQLLDIVNDAGENHAVLLPNELTDVSCNKTLVALLRVMKNNKPIEFFVDNLVLFDTTAEGIANTLLHGLQRLGIDGFTVKINCRRH